MELGQALVAQEPDLVQTGTGRELRLQAEESDRVASSLSSDKNRKQ
jgi:hypothetical protein